MKSTVNAMRKSEKKLPATPSRAEIVSGTEADALSAPD